MKNIEQYTFVAVILIMSFDMVLSFTLGEYSGYIRLILIIVLLLLGGKSLQIHDLVVYGKESIMYVQVMVVFLVVVAFDLIVNHNSVLRIVYAFPFYAGFVSVPLLVKRVGEKIAYSTIINVMICVATIHAFLCLIDYVFDLRFVMGAYRWVYEEFIVYNPDGSRRIAGLMRSTTMYMYFFPAFIGMYLFIDSGKNNIVKISLVCGLVIIAAVLSMSRAVQIFTFASVVVILFAVLKNQNDVRAYKKISIVIIFILVTVLISIIFGEELWLYTDRLNDLHDRGNKTRINAWTEGLGYLNELSWFFGKGLSSTSLALSSRYGYYPYYHYESTYLYSYVEAGYLGLFLRIFPVFVLLKLAYRVGVGAFILGLIYAVNIGVAPLGAVYITNLVLYVSIGLLMFHERDLKKRLSSKVN